jgi:hypothetical protein
MPPAAQPSFFQRNPILSGLVAGFAGSWIGHLLFGATNAPAASHDTSGDAFNQDGSTAVHSGPSAGLLLMVMAVGAVAVYYFYRRRQGSLSSVFSGGNVSPRSEPPVWVPSSIGILSPSLTEPKVTTADVEEFRHRLIDVQAAWSRQDIESLRRVATPEIVQYFSEQLADNVSQGVENRVEDVVVTGVEVREAWTEEARCYATVLLQWKAKDWMGMKNGEEPISKEFAEAWTFVKHRDGQWLLSAIQQV